MTVSTALILDAIVVITLVIAVIFGVSRGLLTSVLRLGGFILSIIVAWFFSGKLATLIYNGYVKDRLVTSVSDQITSTSTESVGGMFSQLIAFASKLTDGTAVTGDNAAEISENIINSALASPVQAVLRTIIFIILFAICLLVIKLISRLFRSVNNIPVIGVINKIGGGVFGLVEGLIVCYLFVAIAAVIITLTNDTLLWLNYDIVDQSKLFSLLYGFNPVQAFLDSGIVS